MIYSYRRVSTDDQPNGPKAQADAIQGYVSNRSDSAYIAFKDHFDDGVSGSVPLLLRPQGRAMCSAVKRGDTIVAAKLDRLFRSVGDAAGWIEQWNKDGVTLVALAEGFDMTNPYGKAMAQMASVFAELEREMIGSRTKAALDAKRRRGECVGEVPFGYDRVGNTMVVNQIEQIVTSDILHMRDAGHDARLIADALNKVGIHAKKGGKWHRTQVQRVIDAAKKRHNPQVT